MIKRLKTDTEFISITKPQEQPWITNIYSGERNELGNHSHLALSGASVVAGTWYLRDLEGNELVKNGSPLVDNNLLLNSTHPILRCCQDPNNSMMWNLGSLELVMENKVDRRIGLN